MHLILASASYGREYLLKGLKIPYQIIPSKIDEDKIVGKNLVETIKLRAKLKGENVAQKISKRYTLDAKRFLILSADTEVIINNKLLGKPRDYKDAVAMLSTLSGKTHEVISGFYLVKLILNAARSSMFSKIAYGTHEPRILKEPRGNILKLVQDDNVDTELRYLASKKIASTSDVEMKVWQGFDRSFVTFRKLTDPDIKLYLSVTEYTRYTGSYALVASPQNYVTKVEGSISNVIGLPLEKIIPILKENHFLTF